MEEPVTKPPPRIGRWLLGGSLLGALAASGLLLVEMARRISHKAGGGGGESGDWGEPLFFAILLAIPGALVGLIVGVAAWGVALGLHRADAPKKDGP